MTEQAMRRIFAVLVALSLTVCLSAQEPAATKPDDPLAKNQKQLAEQLEKLEALLLRSADIESVDNPTRAALLQQAAQLSKQTQLSTLLDKASQNLNSNQYSEAIEQQKASRDALKRVLELLQSENREKRVREQRDQVRRWIEDADRLLRMQSSLRGRTEGGQDAQKAAEDQARLSDKAEQISKDLQGETGKGKDSQADKDKADRDNKAEKADPKSPEMKSKEGDSGENKSGEKSSKDGKEKSAETQTAEGQQEDSKSAESDSSKKDSKKGSESQPADGKSPPSTSEQDSKSDDKAQPNSSQQPNQDQQGKDQQAKDQQQKGERGQQPKGDPQQAQQQQSPNQKDQQQQGQQQQGQQQQGQQQGEQQQGQQQQGQQSQENQDKQQQQQQAKTPAERAQEQIKEAQQRMKETEKDLKDAKREGAVEKQREAEENLKQAIQQLEEILKQLREEEVKRSLETLTTRLRRMLDMQDKIYEESKRLHEIAGEQPDRQILARASALALDQRKVATEGERALLLLKEEGSSAAFPEALEQVNRDAGSVADRFDSGDVGKVTLVIQADIVQALEEMVEALAKIKKENEEKKQQQQQQQQQGGGQMDPSQQPLINKLAELRLIRTLQVRVNKRTTTLSQMLDNPAEPVGQAKAKDLVEQLKDLGKRQESIESVTRKVATEEK